MSQGIVSSRTVSIGELLRSGSFEPANLQREYCWGEPQQTDLMEDLVAQFGRFGFDPEPETAIPDKAGGASADPAFELAARSPELEKGAPYCLFGNVDLFPEGPVFEIYDGLQRITTFSVLFAVIRDLLKAKKDDGINTLLVTEKGQFRLSVPMKNDTLEHDVLTPGRTARPYKEEPGLTEPGQRLRLCAGIMHDMLAEWPAERLRAFGKFVSDHVLVSVTTIRDRRMASQSFVKNNSAGVPLKPEENLKGQLMDIANSVPNREKAMERILWVWRYLQDDLGQQGFDEFLKAVDFIERRQYQSSDYPILLMEHIRRRYTGEQGFLWATDRLLQYRAAFRWLFEAQNEEVAVGVHASLRRLHLLKWRQWQAFAMLIAIRSQPHNLAERIDILDRCCFALTLTSEQRRFADVIGRKIDRFARGDFGNLGGFVFKQIQHDKIRNMLSSQLPEGGKRSTIVRWVEAMHFGKQAPHYVLDPQSSVEHVYPRNPGQHWTTFEAGLELTRLKALRELLGNLCVLPRDELGNAGWDEKRREYMRFKSCKFAQEIAKTKLWTPDIVQSRTSRLVEATLKFLDLEVEKD